MTTYKLTGRQACRGSAYHTRLHNEAIARARAFAALKAAGKSEQEIGELYGTSWLAVRNALKRYEDEL